MKDRTLIITLAGLAPRPVAATITKWSDETAGIILSAAESIARDQTLTYPDFRLFTPANVDALFHLVSVFTAAIGGVSEHTRARASEYLHAVLDAPDAVAYTNVRTAVANYVNGETLTAEVYGALSQALPLVGESVLEALREGSLGVEQIASLDKTGQHLLWRGVAAYTAD